MRKKKIVSQLEKTHIDLINWLSNQEDEKWTTGPEGKWTTGQVALHLLQSITPLNNAMSLPKFVLRLKFGSSNRDVRNFETVINRYNERLEEASGMTFKASKNMKIPSLNDKNYILDRLKIETKKLEYKILKNWTGKQLNTYVLPHPLMGKMPIRELTMWTSYHINHHLDVLKEKY